MNRKSTKLVRVPVIVDVRTFVQLQGKAKKHGVHVVKYNSDFVVSSVRDEKKADTDKIKA